MVWLLQIHVAVIYKNKDQSCEKRHHLLQYRNEWLPSSFLTAFKRSGCYACTRDELHIKTSLWK